ncbi:MAG: TolC family protein [Magnetococcales bacterium]|nr:TolC family protein [Magnetococcales bacterium]
MSVHSDKSGSTLSSGDPSALRALGLFSLMLGVVLSGCSVKLEPVTPQAVERRVQKDLGSLFSDQEPSSYQIGLHEAMARAVKYNLKRRVRQMEEAIAVEDLSLAKKDLLPKIAASAGYSVRDSERVITVKNTNLEVVEKDNSQGMAGLSWAWSVLDFGVGYVQARQKADRVMIHRQHRRKSIQTITQEVRSRYWQAAMTDFLVPRLDALLEETKLALRDVQRMEAAGQEVPAVALEDQQILLDTTHQLWEMRKRLVEAKTQLAVLMNLPPGTLYLSSPQAGEVLDDTLVYLPVEALDHYALLNRSELRVEDYEERMSALEVRKVLLKMLPNLMITEGLSHESNQYLHNQTWRALGMQISWDLFNLAATPQKMAIAKLKKEVVRSRRLAFSMATVTQLRIALQSYHISQRDLSIAQDIHRLQARKVRAGEVKESPIHRSDIRRIEQRAKALVARMDQGMAFAQMQSALGRIQHTLGIDPLPQSSELVHADIRTLSQLLAMRQASATTAVISAIPKPLLLTRMHPSAPVQPSAETDTGALERKGVGQIWNGLEKVSDTLEQWTKEEKKPQTTPPTTLSAPPAPLPGYLPPGVVVSDAQQPISSEGFPLVVTGN